MKKIGRNIRLETSIVIDNQYKQVATDDWRLMILLEHKTSKINMMNDNNFCGLT